eukprot:PhM_4_TR9101/c0_g1_i1/m.80649
MSIFKIPLLFAAAVVAVVSVALVAMPASKRNTIPAHLLGHTLVDRQDFLSDDTVEQLLANTRRHSPIYSATKEPAVFKSARDNIGEAVPANLSAGVTGAGRCPHRLLTLDNTGTRCVLPGRIDVGRHYLMTGGPEAKKERIDVLTSRVQPFLHYVLDYKNDAVTKRLLESPDMQRFAQSVCPEHKPYLDPFQFNYVVNLPGQTVANHIDAVYFRRASRVHMPQWLLAVMAFSGLFRDDFVDQVQVVAYYHKWRDDRGGHFYFWNNATTRQPEVSYPISKSANSIDGSKVVHAAAVYMPWRTPPLLPRGSRNSLEYVGETEDGQDHVWEVKSDGAVLQSYKESELRFSAVYRCRCFKDKADKDKYDEEQKPENAWTLEHVLGVLKRDLVHTRGVVASEEAVERLGPIQLAELLLDTYVKYPLSPTALIPYNLCAVGELDAFSWLKPALNFVC